MHAIVRLGGFNQVATAFRLQCSAAVGRQRAGKAGRAGEGASLGVGARSEGAGEAALGRSKALPRAQSAPAGRADLIHRVADQVCQSNPATQRLTLLLLDA